MSAIVSLLVIIVAVYILAIVTDEFFIISLDKIATNLEMPSDVAGASLMAVGSSAPELFIALSAVFLGGEHGSVGIGTIVGSAVFNILVITGASAAIVGNMEIPGGGVERDIIFYLGSVALLLWVFRDGQVTLIEALYFVAAYVVYIVILWRWGENNPYVSEPKPAGAEEEKKHPTSTFGRVNHFVASVIRLIARDPEKNYIWAMIVSIMFIAGISLVLVEAAVVFSNAIGLPPVIVSLTLLAAGTSAPDLIASVSVARDGRGEMAVANAVGSDIFDVLVGLGLPWLITLVFLSSAPIHIDTEGLVTSIFILSGTTILLYIFLYTKRELSRIEGWILLAVYAAYALWVIFANSGAGTV